MRPWINAIAGQRPDGSSLENAGTAIGRLERFLMLSFFLLEQYTSVGIVLALKAAYRFKDTADHARAEYMLLGTFLSLSITLVVGWVTVQTLRML